MTALIILACGLLVGCSFGFLWGIDEGVRRTEAVQRMRGAFVDPPLRGYWRDDR